MERVGRIPDEWCGVGGLLPIPALWSPSVPTTSLSQAHQIMIFYAVYEEYMLLTERYS